MCASVLFRASLVLLCIVAVMQNGGSRAEEPGQLRLEAASWVPQRDPSYGWWGAVPAGGKLDAAVKQRVVGAGDRLDLAPGSYDVYWVQEYATRERPLPLAVGVKIEAGQVSTVKADTGVRLEVASWVPKRDGNYGWWGAAPAGTAPDHRINWSNAADALLLPAGAYDIYWVQEYATRERPLLLAAGVKIEAGHGATVKADSGIRPMLTTSAPMLDPQYGWWGAAPAGSRERLNWWQGRTDLPLLLPPGTYDVYRVEAASQPSQLAAAAVTVEPHELRGVALEVVGVKPVLIRALGARGIKANDGASGPDIPASVREVDAWYEWQGADSGHRVEYRWTKDGSVIVQGADTLDKPAGRNTVRLKLSDGTPLPPGNYAVELSENGEPATPLGFHIGGTTPGKSR